MTPATARAEVENARLNLVGWLRYYRDSYPHDFPTDLALAKRMGVTKGAFSQLFTRPYRDFKISTLLGACRALRMSSDVLLFTPAPPTPPKKP